MITDVEIIAVGRKIRETARLERESGIIREMTCRGLWVVLVAGCATPTGLGDAAAGTDAGDSAMPVADDSGVDAAAEAAAPDLAPAGPPYTLSVTLAGNGLGSVVSSPAGISCSSGTCAALFSNQSVTLTASVGHGSFFQGWTGDCSRAQLTCVVAVNQSRNVTATFSSVQHNLVFVSSASYAANLGSAAAYDQKCNQLATAAGINNDSNDAFVALVRDGSREFAVVLGAARGFVRVDGAPIADTAVNLLSSSQMFNNIGLDEHGTEVLDGKVLSGISPTADLSYTCFSWTSTSTGSYAFPGNTSSGPVKWLYSFPAENCSAQLRLYCFMKTLTVALSSTVTAGKKIYLSNSNFSPGGGLSAADALCDAQKPLGTTGTGKALLATTSASASSRLHQLSYVRPDGQLVGTGNEISLGNVHTGIWQRGDGSYVYGSAWSGTEFVNQTAATANNCHDWTSAMMSDTALIGDAHSVTTWWSNTNGDPAPCSTAQLLRCFEE